MSVVNKFFSAAAAGALFGAVIGSAESVWLMQLSELPDHRSLFYAPLLYGLIGAAIGTGAGIFGLAVGKFSSFFGSSAAWGASGATVLMAAFVLRYQLNKVVYAEQGVPHTTLLLVLIVSSAIALLCFWRFPKLPREFSASVSAPIWLGLWLLMGGISLILPSSGVELAKANRCPFS